MATSIHPTAIVERGAELGENVSVGPYAVIGPEVRIGDGSSIGAHAVVQGRTSMGRDTQIFPHAAVGFVPQDLKYAGEPTRLEMGDGNIVREFATIHIGTDGGGGVTRLGNRNLLMAYSHVAHDCTLGDGNILANCGTLAGHVTLGNHVILGGLSAVHQFVRIGDHAFISGGSMVAMDVPPYCTAQGDRAKLVGLNTVGLKRHGWDAEAIRTIKNVYRTVFRSDLGLKEALAQVRAEHAGDPRVQAFVEFIEKSERGVAR
ncbi:MAG: acyl-ACP--UDP-N-acetylglucosamine O-acyltransferase [Deltaproteobacteria bacterium]|nr:MAG: acyl-ACP--UDP-N-acetylglucosamine O-acyltransferase [Deltaproteobacteria bacterium]